MNLKILFAAGAILFSGTIYAQATINEVAKLLASDGGTDQQFGNAVAFDGDTIVVGARIDDSLGYNSGAAYVFARNAGVWTEDTKLTASDGAAGALFGGSISLSGDTVVLGAAEHDGLCGAVYVFTHSAGVWTEEAKLTASDGADYKYFGSAVEISGDTLVVGAYSPQPGAAYVFTRDAGVWTEQAKLTASDEEEGVSLFGASVALSGDTVVVGAHGTNDSRGAAYVFTRNAGVWTQEAKLTEVDGAQGHQFGSGVAVSGDTAVVGANGAEGPIFRAGAVYVFTRDAGVWTEEAKLMASDAQAHVLFGIERALSISGDTVVVGAERHNEDGPVDVSGATYVFTRDGSFWTQKVKFLPSDRRSYDNFGTSVALSGDSVVVGANLTDHLGTNSGAAYYFVICAFDEGSPTALAGLDQAIRAGDTVSLDGSASFDDNTPSNSLHYSWNFSSLPAGSLATLQGANTSTPSFIADVQGTYTMELVVTDEAGLSSCPDEVQVSSDNLAPTAAAGDDQLTIVGQIVGLDGSNSSDAENDPLTYAWTITDAPVGSSTELVSENTVSPYFTPDLEGLYVVKLVVSDPTGPGAPDTVEITATTIEDFAEIKIVAVAEILESLDATEVTTGGNQTAFMNFLSQAMLAIQEGDPAEAIQKLEKLIARTDGCALRGSPDGNGPGRDWITDCTAQAEVYTLLNAALGSLAE